MTPQGHTNKTGQAICLCNTAHSKKREDFNYTQRAEVEFRGNMVIKVHIFFFPQQTFAHLGFECNSNDNVRFKKTKLSTSTLLLLFNSLSVVALHLNHISVFITSEIAAK